MRFEDTRVAGAKIVHPERIEDQRGFFARIWCEETFQKEGLSSRVRQSNMASNHALGTLRGLHAQRAPHEEVKIVRCVAGAMYDVVVDLRPDSPTYLKWDGVELTEANDLALYVPQGCATGYLTLTDKCVMYYHTSEIYHPESAFGIRYDDPAFRIDWPIAPTLMSEQDATWPYIETDDRGGEIDHC